MDRSCNCPQCESPDVLVVRRPNVVECLRCGCKYELDDGGAAAELAALDFGITAA